MSSSRKNARTHSRIPFVSPIRLSWEDSAVPRFASGKCLDISQGGLHVEITQEIPVGTRVMLSVEKLKLTGPAVVKHVARRGGKFDLGLELSQALHEQTLAAIRERLEPFRD
jgi:PilZ domain-containing protein